ncbi:DUF86 domain-containing protein [Thermosulfurimonas sp. F29]|uniref:type VII toxin-antitoxin system HepT family RNase toxin n=1 Tax=Thermosulfurimonas sp. F29 TaxID=2867247 RepID=UPI001C83E01B|nr:HepT-like ribonuclease domain-containing protein [Thermosulfurimonas sp. F29]MBX6422339.1 DUF86 domain-containing protein [Thermosulfurimonas sp. F29]
MRDRERLLKKMESVENYLRILEEIKEDCLEKFDRDPIYRGALLHYLYFTADSCIALAQMMVRWKGLGIPQSYQEAIEMLGDRGVLETGFAYEFARIAGLRSLLAHGYEKVKKDLVCEEILPRMEEVRTYLEALRRHL